MELRLEVKAQVKVFVLHFRPHLEFSISSKAEFQNDADIFLKPDKSLAGSLLSRPSVAESTINS